MRRSRQQTRRRSVALLMTILLITLLMAVTTQLVSATSIEAAVGRRRHHTLRHELAVDSALLFLAQRLTVDDRHAVQLIEVLDRLGTAQESFRIDAVDVRCDVRDDGVKFNPLLFQREDQGIKLTRKLRWLAGKWSLPEAVVSLQPIVSKRGSSTGRRYVWYDQLLADVQPATLVRRVGGKEYSQPVWSDVVTLWGDGRVDLRRADEEVLEAVLEDIRPGLANALLSARPVDRSVNFLPSALTRVHAEIRQAVAARLTYDARRYAIHLETAIAGDRRGWYVVATLDRGVVNVMHRSQVTW